MPTTVRKLSRYASMTPEKEKKIDVFLERVKANYDPLPEALQYSIDDPDGFSEADTPHNCERLFAYQYLISRRWDVDKAYSMMERVTAFRKSAHLGHFGNLPAAFSLRGWDQEAIMQHFKTSPRIQPSRIDKVGAELDPHLQFGLHCWDKNGLPVLYLMLGNVDERGLLKKLKQLATVGQKPVDVLSELIQHGISVGGEVCLYQQLLWKEGKLADKGVDASEGLIRSFTIVVDCKGLSYKMLWKPALDLFTDMLRKIFDFWPDCVNRIVVVNAPSMVMFAYNLIKAALDEGVRKKISFHNPKETRQALLQVIDVKCIPQFLGGKCDCEGRCIRGYNPENPKERSDDEEHMADVVTENITLKAGKKHMKIFHAQKENILFWDFAVADRKEVNYGVYFIPAANELSDEETYSMGQLQPFSISHDAFSTSTDSFQAQEDGTVVLVWDNKASWFTSKAVQMRVYMQTADGVHNSESMLVSGVSTGNFVPPAEALNSEAPIPRGGVKTTDAQNAADTPDRREVDQRQSQSSAKNADPKRLKEEAVKSASRQGSSTHNASTAGTPKTEGRKTGESKEADESKKQEWSPKENAVIKERRKAEKEKNGHEATAVSSKTGEAVGTPLSNASGAKRRSG